MTKSPEQRQRDKLMAANLAKVWEWQKGSSAIELRRRVAVALTELELRISVLEAGSQTKNPTGGQ